MRIAGLIVVLIAVGLRYPDNPPPGHTGGFGEANCQACHFDGELNTPGGNLWVEGLQSGYRPGEQHRLMIRLEKPGALVRAGFQLSIRFEDGLQAGTFAVIDDRVAVDTLQKVQYARHTRSGATPAVLDSTHWFVYWRAPDSVGTLVLNLAANAANGDESAFGDAIYQIEMPLHGDTP